MTACTCDIDEEKVTTLITGLYEADTAMNVYHALTAMPKENLEYMQSMIEHILENREEDV